MESPIENPQREGDLTIRVRATPKATRDAVQGLRGNVLKVSVQAPPESGKANDAVRKLLAQKLQLRTAQVELVSGKSSRDKRFRIAGVSREELESRIADVLDERSQKKHGRE